MYLDITESELQQIYEKILTILGAHTVDVDITKEEVKIMLDLSLQEFEKETSIWQLQNQFGNIYGSAAGLIQTNQIATQNFSIVNQITDWFASMGRVGGKIPWHKDYITLEPGRQIYDLSRESSKPYPSGTRRIHRVMWCAKPEILNFSKFSNTNPGGDDILYSSGWNFGNGGLQFGSNALAYVGYSFDTIMMLQAQEQRNKVLFSEFFHNLSGDIVEITPMPGVSVNTIEPGMKLFYYYFAESEVLLNAKDPNFEYMEASDTISYSQTAENVNLLIANPIDMKINYTYWSMLSPWAETWIFQYTLARCKYIQGSKWRKIKKTFATGEMQYEIEFDYNSLLSEASEEMRQLTQGLKDDLKELNVVKLFEDKANIVENANKVSKRQTRLWTYM